jgi:hypothetical protein
LTIRADLDLSVLNLDGTQSLAKQGGEKVAYQGRKKGKTSNILPITDRNGYVIASTGILEGNHNDAYEWNYPFKEPISMPTVRLTQKKLAKPVSIMA